MASDGSIIIDTGLDNSGFERDAGKLEKAIGILIAKVETIGLDMTQALTKMLPAVQAIAAETSQAYAKMMQSEADAARTEERLEQSQQSAADKAKQTAEAFQAESKSAQNAAQDLEKMSEQAERLDGGMVSADFSKSVRRIESEANKLNNQFTRMGDSLAMGLNTDAQLKRFQLNLTHTSDSVQQLTQKIYSLRNQKIPTEDYQRITNEVKKAEAALFRLYDKQDQMNNDNSISETSGEWIRLQKQIERAEIKLNQYEATKAKLEQSGNAFISGADTQEAVNLTAKLQELQQKLAEYEQTAAGFDSISEPAARSAKSVRNLNGSMERTSSTVKKLAKQLAKMALSKVASGFKNLAQRMKQFITQGRGANNTANGLVKSLLKMKNMLASRVKETLITQVFQQAKASLNALAQFSTEFNRSMSSITNRSKELSANLSVSLGTLINAVTPLLTSVMDMASKAITYLNSFFAMLSGKSNVIVAKKQTASYADSLQGTANSADNAADSVENLNEQLYGFDEINKQNADNNAASGAVGAGAANANAEGLFETAAIESIVPQQVKAYMNSLKDAIKSGDWYNVGSIAASGLNQAIQAADAFVTGTLTPKIVGWVQNITSVLNGFVDNFNWYNLGTLIGDSLNGIFLAFDTFLTNFHALNLGNGIGSAINGMFDGINWDLAGKTVGDGLNSISDLIYGFGSTIKWKNIASNLAEGFNSALRTWDPSKTARAIFSVINGGVKFVATLLKKIKWGELVTKILDFLKLSIEEFDWASAGELITAFVDAVYDIFNALMDYDWKSLAHSIGNGIGELLGNIDWADVLGKVLVMAVRTAGFLITQLPNMLGFICEILAGIFESIGLDGVAGFFKGISDAMSGIGDWIREHIVDPVVTWIKNLFGIHSPSTVLAEIGGYLMEGLKNGVSEKMTAVVEKFTEIKDKIVGAFSNLKDKVKEKFSAAYESAKGAWSTAKDKFQEIKDNVVTGFDSLKENIQEKFSDAYENAKEAWSTAKTKFVEIKNNVVSAFRTLKDNIKEKFSMAYENAKGAWSTAKTKFTEIKNNVVAGFQKLRENVREKFDAAYSTAQGVWGDAKSKFQSIKDNIVGAFDGFDIDMNNIFVNAWNAVSNLDWWGLGGNILDGIMGGISNITGTVQSWGGDFVRSIKGVLGIHSPSRVFRDEVGYYLGMGIAAGLEDSGKAIDNTVSGITRSITHGLPNLAVLRQLGESYTPMALNAMPQHTKAKIARGETFSSNPNSAIKMDLLLTKLDAIISKIGDSNNTGIEKNENTFILKLGEKEIATSVVRQINQITRATGRSPLLSR